MGLWWASLGLYAMVGSMTVWDDVSLYRWKGKRVLKFGWLGILHLHLGWYANPGLVLCWGLALFEHDALRTLRWWLSGLTALAALSAVYTVQAFPIGVGENLLKGDFHFRRFGPGFYCWLAAACVPLLAGIVEVVRHVTQAGRDTRR